MAFAGSGRVQGGNSSTLNPLDLSPVNPHSWDAWQYITISGVPSPGVIPVDGIHGFKRETEWDKKKGKGAQGATLTLVQYPPAEGSIDFLLWLPGHFDSWSSFRTYLRYNTAKQAGDAVDIYHPSLADLDINAVVTKSITPIYHKGRGLYMVTVEFIEWFPPPAKPIVATPKHAAPDQPNALAGAPADTAGDARQAQIEQLMKQGSGAGKP